MSVIGQRKIQINGRKEDDEDSSNNDEDENDWWMGNPFDDVKDGVFMYGGCIKGMHSEEGVVHCLRLWYGKTIGKSVGGPVILQINGDEVNIDSLVDISACINSYLSEKQLEISGSLSVRDEEQSVDESPKKALSLGQLSLKGASN